MIKRIMILSIWAIISFVPAGHAEEKPEGNKGYIFGSPKEPVADESEAPQEKTLKTIKPRLREDINKVDSWIEKNLW